MENKSNPIVSICGLTKKFRTSNSGPQFEVLKKINLQIQANEFVAIIGPSGSGKSTLMNIMGLLDHFDEGEYFLDGMNVKDLTEIEKASIRNSKISFIFQNFNLLPRLTAYENVEVPLIYQGISRVKRNKKITEALERVGLSDRMKHKPAELSGGQKQRVAIARGLVTNAPIIIADEPTGALDSKTGENIMELLKELNEQGKTIIMITHNPILAKQSDRTLVIKDGDLSTMEVFS